LKPLLRAAADQLLQLTEIVSRNKMERKLSGAASTMRAETPMVTASKALGMSYEVTNVQLADIRARVWVLEKVTFTGAAILHRDKAAYRNTWIELGV
jgi:transketolase N-terminal domain/subunit